MQASNQNAVGCYIFHSYVSASTIARNVSNTSSKPLQSVQNRILRILEYNDIYFPINQMHKSYGILKIPDIVQHKQSKIITNRRLKTSPSVL